MTLSTAHSPLPANPVARLWADAPYLTGLTLFIGLTALPVLAAMLFDGREFQGDNVWLKPFKFHVALFVYTGTLAFYARFLPAGTLDGRRWRIYQVIVTGAILAELWWIGGAASLGTASHFNNSTPFWAIAYGLMGVAAVTLTSISFAMGVAFWKRCETPFQLSLALGLVLTFVLTVIVASTMSSGTGHYIGTPVTDARLPILGWSREVGDLRVPHFLATHALHAIPLAGLTGSRAAVWLAALGYTGLVLACFAQALLGMPLI